MLRATMLFAVGLCANVHFRGKRPAFPAAAK
jgi:hypothetical protein